MGVEILILSGNRQGERLVLDRREFTVGSDAGCEVFFDANSDPSIRGRSALFRCQDDGWYVRSGGGEVLVNQQPVTGWMRVRSGDVVRMSECGPDFAFSIVTDTVATAVSTPSVTNGLPLSNLVAIETIGGRIPTPVIESAPNCAVGCGSAAKEWGGVSDMTESPRRDVVASATPERAARRWAVWVGARSRGCDRGLDRWAFSAFTTNDYSQPGSGWCSHCAGHQHTEWLGLGSTRSRGREQWGLKVPWTHTAGRMWKEKGRITPTTRARYLILMQRLRGAVYLLQVEKAGRCWPFATCVALSRDTLLTTAREVAQLARWREEGGFKIWVTQPTNGFREEVQDLRINDVFASLAEKPGDWVYYNLGLLTVRARLPEVAVLASNEELAGLEEGVPVACFGFFHEGEKTTRFDKFEPRLARAKDLCHHRRSSSPGAATIAARQGRDSQLRLRQSCCECARNGARRVQRGGRPTCRQADRF